DGRLLATAKDDRAHLNAYLDDYAFLAAGILELLQARWRTDDFDFALALARVIVEQFEDKSEGGFYFTSNDHERLVHRPKPTADEALPAGNGVAAQTLLRLGYLLGDFDFLRAAERTVKATYARVARYPSAHCALVIALEEYLHPPPTIVLRGSGDELAEWRRRLLEIHVPQRLAFAIPDAADPLPGLLAERKSGGGMTAYVCSGHTCQPPVTQFEALEEKLLRD
ncbi:MAG TPA: hypothetical protein VI565_09315, partial [Burkholderiales bacterium]|nr:hypothetical protein [Burkholderiales bacterium]